MITLKNPSAASEWIIDLKEYSQVENALPMSGLNVRNDSNIVAYVDLDGLKVGEVQRYSADPFQGRNFSLIRIYNPDGQDFAANDLFIQATKGEVMGSQPFNPQWDIMYFDLDRYATGTNTRISLSDSMTLEMIKYRIRSYNALITQRRLDVQAHATLLGEYSITFGANDILSGAVGIGVPPPPDTTLYKKVIANHQFDYSTTNCEIVGWVIDYFKAAQPTYTLISGSNGSNAYDGDQTTFTDEYNVQGTTWATRWEVSFPSQPVINCAMKVAGLATGGNYALGKLQLKVNEVWTDVLSYSATHPDWIDYEDFTVIDYSAVTGARLQLKHSSTADYRSYAKIYDIVIT